MFKTVEELLIKSAGKYIMMQSCKDFHSELDARKNRMDLSYLFIMKVGLKETSFIRIYADAHYYSSVNSIANGSYCNTVPSEQALELINFNIKRKNNIEFVEEYISSEQRNSLIDLVTKSKETIGLAMQALRLFDYTFMYKHKVNKVPEKAVCHNHGYPYNMLSYVLDGKRYLFSERYSERPDITTQELWFNPSGFLLASNYRNTHNDKWAVYKPTITALRSVHTKFEEGVELAKSATKIYGQWLKEQKILPR